MRKLTTIQSVAAPLPESDVDTDAIFPARFLLLLNRKGLGKHLFHERRQTKSGETSFVLDQPDYKGAQILVTGERFGIGSSREHAVWALADFGIRCIIAPSFGDIFHANCLKNGVLPIRLEGADLDRVMNAAKQASDIEISLEAQRIVLPDGETFSFEIAPQHKHALINGLDDIASILADDGEAIAAFEAKQKTEQPWLALSDDQLSGFVRSD